MLISIVFTCLWNYNQGNALVWTCICITITMCWSTARWYILEDFWKIFNIFEVSKIFLLCDCWLLLLFYTLYLIIFNILLKKEKNPTCNGKYLKVKVLLITTVQYKRVTTVDLLVIPTSLTTLTNWPPIRPPIWPFFPYPPQEYNTIKRCFQL
jgi:hypothetical protein